MLSILSVVLSLALACHAHTLPTCYDELSEFSISRDNPLFFNASRVQVPTQWKPAFVCMPSNENQLQQALQCAHRYGLQVAIKSGGHSFAAYSSIASPGFQISMHHMQSVHFDESTRVVTVQGGAQWHHVYHSFSQSNGTYQVVGGLCPTVGVAGYTSGGGVGPLARQYGLAMDNVISFRLVLADGRDVVEVTAENENKELFWGVLGSGGGNWGVISSLVFRAHRGPEFYTWALLCYNTSLTSIQTGLNTLATYAEGSPHWLNLDATLDPDQGLCLWVTASNTQNNTEIALQPFITSPGVTIASAEYHEFDCFWEMIESFAQRHGYSAVSDSPFISRTYLVPSLTPITEAITDAVSWIPSDYCDQHFIQWGGQIMTRESSSTAFPWRNSTYMVYLSCDYQQHNITQANQVFAAVHKWSSLISPYASGGYINFIDPYLPNWESSYYGSNLPRLMELKSKWNPTGTSPLRFPMEIGAQQQTDRD